MILFSAVFFLLRVAADQSAFCLDDPNGDPENSICFTGWPAVDAVCPNHNLNGAPHGHIDRRQMADALIKGYPDDCQTPNAEGIQRCTMTVMSHDFSKPGRPNMEYAYLWTDRYIDGHKRPSYQYGGLGWRRVCTFHIIGENPTDSNTASEQSK